MYFVLVHSSIPNALQFSFSSQQLFRWRTVCPSLLSRDTASHQPLSEAPPPQPPLSLLPHSNPQPSPYLLLQDHVTSPSKCTSLLPGSWSSWMSRRWEEECLCSNFIFYFNDPLPVNVDQLQCCLGADLYQMHILFSYLLDWQWEEVQSSRQYQRASLVPIPPTEVRDTHVQCLVALNRSTIC